VSLLLLDIEGRNDLSLIAGEFLAKQKKIEFHLICEQNLFFV